MKRSIFLTPLFLLIATLVYAQPVTQTLRGTVMDKESTAPLEGATIIVVGTNPVKGCLSDADGEFKIAGIPLGRQSIRILYVGYEEIMIPEVLFTSGKEVIVNVELIESVTTTDEVVIEAGEEKELPLNEMATVSARTFDLETTMRFAGSRNDPARMASNFAGVSGANDSRNDIIIRGNSPGGLLWRLEGVNIPNPNHYGALGATGGPVSMLNNNVLAKSDFMSGAFPAQYGNALSGVFDLNMRRGNNEQHEFLGQVSFNGFELGAEGPISKKNKSSYLVNYRYSTLGVFKALGVNFGTGAAVPEYQDINFKFDFPTKNAGRFSVFGLGGVSTIDLLGSETDTTETDLFGSENLDIRPRYRTGIVGISHKLLLNNTTAQNITLAATHTWESTRVDSLSTFDRTPVFQNGITYTTNKYALVYTLNKKFNARNHLRIGANLDLYDFRLRDSVVLSDGMTFFNQKDSEGQALVSQAFAQWKHRITDRLSFNVGVNAIHFSLNNKVAVEPRAGIRYQLSDRQTLSLAYGYHSQLQALPIYFQEEKIEGGGAATTNEDLDFTRSQHFVLAYDFSLAKDLRLKAEAYYQRLSSVPVDPFPSSFSLLNAGADFGLPDNTSLVNEGTGRNMGIELTLEKFFSRNYYFLFTTSLFDSRYTGSDGIERNTAFNGRYVVNALAGKEFAIGKSGRHTLAIDIKATAAGGRNYTPIDLEESAKAGEAIFQDEIAFSERYTDYFRADVKLNYRMNGKKVTHEVGIDIQNVTNRRNIFSQTYNSRTNSIGTEYQLGFFPIPQYRILF